MNNDLALIDLLLVNTGLTGLEPAASAVTGRRSNQLNYSRAGECFVTGIERRCQRLFNPAQNFYAAKALGTALNGKSRACATLS